MNQPPLIDHDPNEPPLDKSWKGIPWAFAAMVALLWGGSLAILTVDWHSVFLGALTGGGFVGFVLSYTGNRVPRWMRR